MQETIKEILDKFAEYANYDPEQKAFNLLSDNYTFHQAGKQMERLLADFDPSGILAVMYAKKTFMTTLDKRIALSVIIPALNGENAECMEELNKTLEMYRAFQSEAYKNAISDSIEDMNKLTMQVCKMKMIGDRNTAVEENDFIDSVMDVSDNLHLLRTELYCSSGRPVTKLEKFTTRILVFNQMADCILQLEQMPDAIYFCYIRQNDTADGYFAFMFKSNGNLFSVNDRVAEQYIGQHEHSRNGRWTEQHAGSMFPYEFIFNYGKYDYKGYASKYYIDDDQLEFSKMDEKATRPILISMILLRNRFVGQVMEMDPVYLNSMFRNSYLEMHPSAELAVLENSQVAIRHNEYQCGIDPDKIMTEEYNKKFGLCSPGQFWVKLYADGFNPDFNDLLCQTKPVKKLKQWEIDNGKKQPEPEYYPEFVGTGTTMDREIYRKVRMQLANYIQDKMNQELKSWDMARVYEYVNELLRKRAKEKFLNAVFKKYFLQNHPERMVDFEESLDLAFPDDPNPLVAMRPAVTENDLMQQVSFVNSKTVATTTQAVMNIEQPVRSYAPIMDDETGTQCVIYAKLCLMNYAQIETMIDETLPRIFQGWNRQSHRSWYNGNSLLDVTDAVGELNSPLYNCDFNPTIIMGFSKKTFQKMYEEWMVKNEYVYVLAADKAKVEQERKEKRRETLNKKNLPVPPFEDSEVFRKACSDAIDFKNMQQIIDVARELYEVFPEAAIGGYGIGHEGDAKIAISVETTVQEKGNKDRIQELIEKRWRNRSGYRACGRSYVRLSKQIV